MPLSPATLFTAAQGNALLRATSLRLPSPRTALIPALALLILFDSTEGGFADISDTAGLDYVHAEPNVFASRHRTRAGAAAIDINGNGRTDLIVARWDAPPLVFLNQGDGTFVEDTTDRGLGVAVDAAAFGVGDFNNNGHPDIFVVPHYGTRFHLFINDGNGFFTEEAEARGVDLTVDLEGLRPSVAAGRMHRGQSVGLVDFDRDGYLDVYISQWGVTNSRSHNHKYQVLLRNRGAEAPGHFENVTQDLNLVQPRGGQDLLHFGFTSGWADFDGNGWPDLALIADYGASRMYWSDGYGGFVEKTAQSGVSLEENGMGIAIADINHNGLLDYFVTSIYDQDQIDRGRGHFGNKLYINQGDRTFVEVAETAGVDQTGWGWGAAFFDHDNSGNPDLIVTNGWSENPGNPSLPFFAPLSDPTRLFRNDGTGQFTDVTEESGISDNGQGRAIIIMDIDGDGAEDIIITQNADRPVVYRNLAADNGHAWIRFQFEGTRSNRDGIGTVVRVTTGDKTQTALYNPSNNFNGQREPFLHFGLGSLEESIDTVRVEWPSGRVQVLREVAPRQVLSLVEPDTWTYAEWAAQYFTPEELADPAIGGPDADPDATGRSNLHRYAFTDHQSKVMIFPVIASGEFSLVQLSHPQRFGTTDLSSNYLISTDLKHWEPVENVIISDVLEPTLSFENTKIITVELDVQTMLPGPVFIKVKAHLNNDSAP